MYIYDIKNVLSRTDLISQMKLNKGEFRLYIHLKLIYLQHSLL